VEEQTKYLMSQMLLKDRFVQRHVIKINYYVPIQLDPSLLKPSVFDYWAVRYIIKGRLITGTKRLNLVVS